MLIGVLCGTPMPRRLFVRLNGRADGGVVVSIGDNTTEEEFLQKATARLFRGKPNHVDPSSSSRRHHSMPLCSGKLLLVSTFSS